MKMRIFILLFPIIFNICGGSSPAEEQKKINKYVTTLIDAKWKETPILLEVAEHLNDENASYFWKYIHEICTNPNFLSVNATSKDRYDAAISTAKLFLSPAEIAVLKLGLSLRIYSAKVEMFTQMAENRDGNLECANFVDVGGRYTCSILELEKFIEKDEWNNVDTYSVDHFYLGKQPTNKTVILYGDIQSAGFCELHTKLSTLAVANKFNYVLRYYIRERSSKQLRLSGYGVELQMKSTEYKATDDSDIKDNVGAEAEDASGGIEEIEGVNFAILKKRYPDDHKRLAEFQTYLLETSHEIGALKVWQFQELSHQAAERIVNSPKSEAIRVLTDISQNFPIQAKSLIKTKVRSEMKKEMKLNQDIFSRSLNIQPTDTALFINGLFYDLETIDVLTLLEALRSELRVMESLHKIGFGNTKMSELLALDLSSGGDNQDFAIDIRDSAIIWVNDIENDSRYSRWSPMLAELLRPTFPGMLRNIRRNMYNLVLIIDPLSKESQPLIALAESLYLHSAPLRIGFVFITNFDTSVIGSVDPSVAVNNAFHYFTETKTPKEALNFLSSLENDLADRQGLLNRVKKAIKESDPNANVEYILGEESEYDVGRHLANDFIKRTGFKSFPQALINGVPLDSGRLSADSFEEAILTSIMTQTPVIQKAFYRGDISEGDDIVEFLMNQTNVMPRLNERILKVDKSMWLNLIGTIPEDETFERWTPQDVSAWVMDNMRYLHISRRATTRHFYSIWIVLDLNSSSGRHLLKEALEYLESNSDVRITIIVNSADKTFTGSSINEIALAALHSLPTNEAVHFLRKLIKPDVVDLINKGEFEMQESIQSRLSEQTQLLSIHKHYSRNIINLADGDRAVICNGRVIGPFDADEEFTADDFSLLERFSHNTYGEKLFKYFVKNDEDNEKMTGDVIMKMSSLLVPRPQTRNRFVVPYNSDEFSCIKIPPNDPDKIAFSLIAIVDPISRGAQKLGPILDVLQQTLNCDIKIFLNCLDKHSDMPLKSFYRFVLEPELQFNSEGEVVGPIAKFTKLPTYSLLTQNIHAPENWLVEVVRSIYDLDNIKLDSVAMGVHSEFELEFLLLEGHCFESMTGNPPRGLQITLGTDKQPVMVDTIVMANLGYYQLKANPGKWLLRLRQGRSAEIYDITSVEGQDITHTGNDVQVLISSLRSHVLKLKVTKKADKVGADLLAEDEKSTGLWNSISRTFISEDGEDQEDEKLNIFSLASGHLYERFLKIMMLSVIRHTKSPVKFWFLKNYLSPTLKDFLPYMAAEYGFEYELIQYKWPRWLHQQTEKQRTIWGYKILFLDVLFPLDVKKIIFVDADQVVRTDLKELANIDLGGAPYGYTPFCDSRKEMDGFRFWRQGYWRNHLQGRAYHISALYVVDLKRFRRIAAGDRLRGQYQALSQDPNSLSNLDQDLPNNMIHQVAIKTLPQDWLWCETWCSDESKKSAKTIDLCNNPMTKEAKLQAAIRILPEWVGLDEEIRSLQHRLENENQQMDKDETEKETTAEDLSKHEEL